MTKKRCGWCVGNALYEHYHDTEWGVPVFDDQTLFEFLLLETFQAGLSWITILKKREHFREAFDDFNYHTIANYNQAKLESLMQNPGIIRNKLKRECIIFWKAWTYVAIFILLNKSTIEIIPFLY